MARAVLLRGSGAARAVGRATAATDGAVVAVSVPSGCGRANLERALLEGARAAAAHGLLPGWHPTGISSADVESLLARGCEPGRRFTLVIIDPDRLVGAGVTTLARWCTRSSHGLTLLVGAHAQRAVAEDDSPLARFVTTLAVPA